VNESEILEVLERKGAVLRGHFLLSSGRHSDVFVQKFRIFETPRLTQRFGESIADLFPDGFDMVASPAIGAITLGFAVALAADVKMIFAERDEGALSFRRGFRVEPHARMLVVEDVITTGGSAKEVVDLVKTSGGIVVGVGALLDRGDPAAGQDFGAPLRTLIRLKTDSWAPEECPLCARSEPLTDPGSRRLG
jgi:orotate phosphoribosyltransferase